MSLKYGIGSHPGSDFMFVLCDACGRKARQYETELVRDRYNRYNNMVICNRCTEKTNEQVIPITVKDVILDNAELARPEPQDVYIVNSNASTVPSAPTNLRAMADPIGGAYIMLQWTGPDNPGNSGIIGYLIEQAIPQQSLFATLVANTGTANTMYLDYDTDVSSECEYRIAAINSSGVGAYSAVCFYPTSVVSIDTNYIGVSQDGTVLATSAGVYIILSGA